MQLSSLDKRPGESHLALDGKFEETPTRAETSLDVSQCAVLGDAVSPAAKFHDPWTIAVLHSLLL